MTRVEDAVPIRGGDADRLADDLAAADGLLLGLDFDGTLAPIVEDPSAAALDPDAVEPLERLADRLDVRIAVISGRALADLRERVDRDDVIYGGNHGLELEGIEDPAETVAPEDRAGVDEARRRVAARVASVRGCFVEDKGPTFSVHVRETPADRVSEVRSAVADVADDVGLRLVAGKQVFEVRPPGEYDKGWAMTTLAASVPDGWLSVYVGDDTTDEDAFRAVQPAGIGVHVGDDETAARYRLPAQEHVGPFLSWLADRRRHADG